MQYLSHETITPTTILTTITAAPPPLQPPPQQQQLQQRGKEEWWGAGMEGEESAGFAFILMHFLDATTHLYKRLCPSVPMLVRSSVLSIFQTTNMAVFEGRKSSNDIIINDTLSDNGVVASDAPRRYLL